MLKDHFFLLFLLEVGAVCGKWGACPNKNNNFACLVLTARATPSPCLLISLPDVPDQPEQHTFLSYELHNICKIKRK